MRILRLLPLLLAPGALAFLPPNSHDRPALISTSPSRFAPLFSLPSDEDRMKKIMQEEAMNPENMKMAKEQLLNLKASDVEAVLRDMDKMPAAQKEQMKNMGMNPDIMRQSLEMLKSNPEMAKDMAKMMDTMTPDQLMERSKQAQERLASTGAAPAVIDAQVTSKQKDDEDDEDDEDGEDAEEIPAPEPELLDAMFRVAELMSDPPTGGVTFHAFAALPPISLLTGDDTERDLSNKELSECWADGSLGSTRVDRKGFERVWMEVQEYFSMEIMIKARERTLESKTRKRGSSKPASSVPAATAPTPVVGAEVPPEMLKEVVTKMSDDDLDTMFDQMKNMTPEMEERMRAMGANPDMLKKTADLMKSNPLMKNAAKMMMKNMSPEQMKNMSEQAQKQMKNMTPEQYQQMMEQMEKEGKM